VTEVKTRPNDADVGAFIDSLADPRQRALALYIMSGFQAHAELVRASVTDLAKTHRAS